MGARDAAGNINVVYRPEANNPDRERVLICSPTGCQDQISLFSRNGSSHDFEVYTSPRDHGWLTFDKANGRFRTECGRSAREDLRPVSEADLKKLEAQVTTGALKVSPAPPAWTTHEVFRVKDSGDYLVFVDRRGKDNRKEVLERRLYFGQPGKMKQLKTYPSSDCGFAGCTTVETNAGSFLGVTAGARLDYTNKTWGKNGEHAVEELNRFDFDVDRLKIPNLVTRFNVPSACTPDPSPDQPTAPVGPAPTDSAK